jgi:hypothetical protein
MKIFLGFACNHWPQAFFAHLLSKIPELFVRLFTDPVTRQLTEIIHTLPAGSQLKAKVIGSCLEIEVILPS